MPIVFNELLPRLTRSEVSRMHASKETLVTALITVSAVALAATNIYRELSPPKRPRMFVVDQQPPTYLKDWKALIPSGILVGKRDAEIKVIEFADFECPYCRQFDSVYKNVERELGDRVALVFVHYPLSIHRFARPAARAAECAAAQGRFANFKDAVYSKQDSLGLKPWASYAVDADIQDTARFTRCVSDTVRIARIEDGLSLGARVKVVGTPTVIVNGWRYDGLPLGSGDSLLAVIGRIASGRKPESN